MVRPDNPRIALGHNNGPTMEPGQRWRRHCWSKARRGLLGEHLPIEVIRGRVRRAAELGLAYKTYASVRAASGHDVLAILFSSNALRVIRGADLPEDRRAKIEDLRDCAARGLAIAPLTPAQLARAAPVLSASHPAPPPCASWSDTRLALRSACGRIPADRVLLIGDTRMETDWARAGRLAGYLASTDYFQTGL